VSSSIAAAQILNYSLNKLKYMTSLKSKQLDRYFQIYRETQISFNKQVIKATGLITDQVQLKCRDKKWPCVLYSASLTNSKIIAKGTESFFETLRNANNRVSLRFSFRVPDKSGPLAFFVPAKVIGSNRYMKEKEDVHLLTLTFNQKPPDDFIEILGQLLEANANSQKRREERIIITQESSRGLGLSSNEAYVFIEPVSTKCIIRDLSFSGATVLLAAVSKSSTNEKAILRLAFDGTDEFAEIPGRIVRNEEVIGKRDFSVLALSFDENKIPMEYKKRINNWLSLRTHTQGKIAFEEEKIGDGLMRIGAMTQKQVEDVLFRKKNGDDRLFGEIAIELGYIDDEAIVKYLAGKGK